MRITYKLLLNYPITLRQINKISRMMITARTYFLNILYRIQTIKKKTMSRIIPAKNKEAPLPGSQPRP